MAKEARKTVRIWLGYGLYVSITLVCGVAAYTFGPTGMGVLVSTPGAVALLAIPWQLFRDQRAHDRSLELSDRNTAVSIGLNSPMAQTAFTRYVTFADEYTVEMSRIVMELVRQGPNGRQVQFAQDLFEIRRRHVLFIPFEVEAAIDQLEQAIWRMSIDAHFVEHGQAQDGWAPRYNAMEKGWAEIIGLNHSPSIPGSFVAGITEETPQTQKQLHEASLQRQVHIGLRQALGTDDFAAIRNIAIQRALGKLETV